jgi:zinc transport system ATP-binding protein
MTDHPLLEVKNVSFAYEGGLILEAVNLSVSQGEFIGIFGPNGGGKTTFLQLLMGFLKPIKGTIRFLNRPPKMTRSHIGYVPQMAAYDKQFPISVLELVLMGCLTQASPWGTFSKTVKKKALTALEQVDLLDQQHAAFGSLSGGQAQRALIARALVSNPELLLLDEPTASIDAHAQKELGELFIRLKGEVTILMVTHDLQEISQRVDRWICINRQLTSYLPSEICEHFGLGLYHTPLIKKTENPF